MTDLAAKYRLQRALSWTSAARTFAGQCPDTGNRVVVKVMSLADEPHRESLTHRFDSTASVLQALGHPTLPDVLDYGMTPAGEAYLVTAWFAGAKLSELDLDPGDVLNVAMQLVEALESLALHGLVHLGIDPENVLVSSDQGFPGLATPGQRAQLTGWGSSLLNVDWQSGQGVVVRVPNSFTAPELANSGGIGEALWRADLYSVAAMVIELLGAEVVGTSEGKQVRFSGELSGQISSPEALRATLQSCLQEDPDGRPDAYSALARALQHSMPRERLPDVTATQPMHALRAGVVGASGAAGGSAAVTDETVLSSRPIFSSEVKNPDAEQIEAPAASSPAELPPHPVAKGAKKVEPLPSETGIHAIRQETGAFVLPKSSSEKSEIARAGQEPLFEADELGRMVEELADEDLLDSPRIEKDGEGLEKHEAGRVAPLPEIPRGSDQRQVPASGGREVPLEEALRGHEPQAPASKLDEEPGPATTAEVALPASAEAAKRSAVGTKAPEVEQARVDSEAATQWVAPEELAKLVEEARSAPEKKKRKPVSPLPPLPPLAGEQEESSDAANPEDSPSSVGTKEPPASSPSRQPTPRRRQEISEESKRREAKEAVKLVAMMRAKSAAEESDAESSDTNASEAGPSTKPDKAKQGVGKGAEKTRRWRPMWLGLAAAVLLVLLVGTSLVFGLLRGKREAPKPLSEFPQVREVVAVPEEAPLFQSPVEIDQAMALIAEGSWVEARQVLDAFTKELASDQEAVALGDGSDDVVVGEAGESREPLRAEYAEPLFAAREALELGQGAEIKERLAPALASLDVNAIRRALRGGAPALAALRRQEDGPELARKARNLLRQVDSFRSALDRGEGTEPLERALDLQNAYPALAERLDAVNRAVKRAEQVALELTDGGRLGEASLLLHEMGERVELSEKMLSLQRGLNRQLAARSRVSEVLIDADSFGQNGSPHRGLELLAGANIQPDDRDRYLELRGRLQTQLTELDAGRPEVDLVAQGLDLRRGEPLVVQLMVVDDYEVVKVNFRLVANGQKAREMPISAQGQGLYSVQIPAGVHQGKPIRFWAAAFDRSGHRGSLGSQEEPIEVRRKRWFQVFRRGGDE